MDSRLAAIFFVLPPTPLDLSAFSPKQTEQLHSQQFSAEQPISKLTLNLLDLIDA